MNKKTALSFIAALSLATTSQAKEDLGTITVTGATKTEQSIKDITSNVEVITSAELEEKNYTTVAQALNSLPGINFTSSGGVGSAASIMLRGMDTKRVLVLIDGISFKDPSSTSGTAFAHLMAKDIERIEVVKGALSSIWGNDATAGVINIITKKAKKGIHSSIQVEKGSFNTNKFHAVVSKKDNNYDMKLSLNRILTDGFTTLAPAYEDEEKYEDDSYRNTTVNFLTNYNLTNNDKIGLNYTNINTLSNYDGYNDPNKIQRSDIKDTLYSIYYNKIIKNHNIKATYNNSDFSRDEKDTTIPTFVKIFDGNLKKYEIIDNFQYNNTDKLLFGSSYEIYDVSYQRLDNNNKDKKVNIKSVFATNTNINSDYIFTQSLRLDDFSTSGKKYTGKIGFKYNINQNISFNTNYGTAYNAPNIMELLNPWGAVGSDVVTPEKTKGYDLSLKYKTFTATYFNNKVTDMISWFDPDPSNSWLIQDGYYTNYTGTSTFKGYELSYSEDILEDILININYTRLNTKNSDGEALAKRPKETIKFGVDYYGFDKTHINLNGEYIGERYNKKNLEGDQTGKYTIFNSIVNYDIKQDIKLYFKIDNITNKYYATSTDNNNNRYVTSPRAYYIGLKYNF